MAAAAILTLLLFLESSRFPWSPFFILHAVLAILLPVGLGAWPPGNVFAVLALHWRAALTFFALLALWEHFFSGHLYERRILKRLGRDKDPYFSPSLALDGILERSARKLGIPATAAQGLFAAYALLWAPFGEDLFFWGYLHATLGRPCGFWPATVLVSAVFAAHHLFYLGGMWERRPWGSLIAFAVSSFVTGILMSLLFRCTGSLYPLMAAHACVNALWIAIPILSAPRESSADAIAEK